MAADNLPRKTLWYVACSQATLTAEDVGVTRDGNKVCVGNEGETFRALMVIPVPRNGVPLVGTFAIKNQGTHHP